MTQLLIFGKLFKKMNEFMFKGKIFNKKKPKIKLMVTCAKIQREKYCVVTSSTIFNRLGRMWK